MRLLLATLVLAAPQNGLYQREVLPADVAREQVAHCEICPQVSVGRWRMRIRGAELKLSGPAREETFERVRADGGRLVFRRASTACRLLDGRVAGGEGIYAWRATGLRLVIRKVRDNCPTRAAIVAGIWTRGTG